MSGFVGEGTPLTAQGSVDGTDQATYELPLLGRFVVESVVASIDASGGGDTTPTLTVLDKSGAVIARKAQTQTIPAGDTGDATWALRLPDEQAAAPTPIAPLYEDLYAPPLAVIANRYGNPAWVHSAGSVLLDLTVPAHPRIIADGIYGLSLEVGLASAPLPGTAFMRLVIGYLVAFASGTFPNEGGAAGGPSNMPLTTLNHLAAGQDCAVQINNDDPARPWTFFSTLTVVRFS